MTISAVETVVEEVGATGVRFIGMMLYIGLSDGREIGVPLAHFPWLRQATPEQRANWSIEPHGIAVWWDDLDDGIEVSHLLSTGPMAVNGR